MTITHDIHNLEVTTEKESRKIRLSILEDISRDFFLKWRRHLLSGEYMQGQSSLCKSPIENDPSQYCCLGIIGKMYNYTDKIMEDKTYLKALAGSLMRVPLKVRENREFNYFFGRLNDNLGLSFGEIAKVLEYIIENNLCKEE